MPAHHSERAFGSFDSQFDSHVHKRWWTILRVRRLISQEFVYTTNRLALHVRQDMAVQIEGDRHRGIPQHL